MNCHTQLDMPLQNICAHKAKWAEAEMLSAGKIKVVRCVQYNKASSVVGPASGSSWLETAKEDAQMAHVNRLLSAMLHPEVEQRMTAEEMEGLQWLQEAAAVPLMGCPFIIGQP